MFVVTDDFGFGDAAVAAVLLEKLGRRLAVGETHFHHSTPLSVFGRFEQFLLWTSLLQLLFGVLPPFFLSFFIFYYLFYFIFYFLFFSLRL